MSNMEMYTAGSTADYSSYTHTQFDYQTQYHASGYADPYHHYYLDEPRFSAESDRGIPRTGVYAQDGFWDEDSLSSDAHTIRPGSSSTTVNSDKKAQSSSRTSVKGRSRSGTVSSMTAKEEVPLPSGGIWAWGKKTPVLEGGEQMETRMEVLEPANALEKKRSKGRLKGRGRRGELTVSVAPNPADESFEAMPLPPTPASYYSASSPAQSTTSTFLSPQSCTQSPVTTLENTNPEKPKSTWKRGMQKLLKSKSSIALREVFSSMDPNRPPVPEPPQKAPIRPPNKPLAASTPPSTIAADQQKMRSFYESPLSPPPSAHSFSFSSHASLPNDPFASTLDMSSNNMPSPLGSPLSPRPRLQRNSPSLRDLKNFLVPSKPRLTKAKSLANIKANDLVVPESAPPTKTHFDLEPVKVAKRTSSVDGLTQVCKSSSSRNIRALPDPPVDKPFRPVMTRMPTESPPLLPPNPPYFPTPSSLARKEDAPLTIDTSPGPPPSNTLPSLPSSSPVSGGASPLPHSTSAVLLPRSRSTSMSLKAPPTSSSFFDLYEQLGIWPTPSEKETISGTSTDSFVSASSQDLSVPATSQTEISQSPSATFSAGSWEAAISAFPVVDGLSVPALDFGHIDVYDQEAFNAPLRSSTPNLGEDVDEPDHTMISNVAVEGSACSDSDAAGTRSSRQTVQGSTVGARSNAQAGPSTRRVFGSSRQASGSHASSGASSRDERPRTGENAWYDNWSKASSPAGSDDEDDDVPLSQIHPEAAASQKASRQRKEAKRAAKAAKARARGRNPGGGTGWDGEGGIPANILTGKLESLALGLGRMPNGHSANAYASDSRMSRSSNHTADTQHRSQMTEYAQPSSSTVARSNTLRKPDMPLIAQQARQEALLPARSPVPSLLPSPVLAQFPSRMPSQNRPSQSSSHTPTTDLSRASSSATSSHRNSRRPSEPAPPVPTVSRSNTTATTRSTGSRSRALSSAGQNDNNHARSVTEPLPSRDRQLIKVNAFIGLLDGKRIILDLYPETTAKDVLSHVASKGELSGASNVGWALVELFAEIGCERQIREYEVMHDVVKGWEPSGRFNCFIIRQSNSAIATMARAIPVNAPFLGAYVQYESKKGKWSKRFLETRGGQVFLSKNDKNKEEVQINTLFHDVHNCTRPYAAPKPFVFVMKRIEPAGSFINGSDYVQVFSTDEAVGFKLAAAIYDAKSYTIAQSKPHVTASVEPVMRKQTIKNEPAPLVDLGKVKKEGKSGFTGKGLLKF